MTYPPPPHDQPYPQQPASPPPFGAAPAGFPPPAPPRRRRVWPWVLGGVALVLVLGCVGAFTLLGAGTKAVSDAADELGANEKGQNAVAGEFGKPAKDGKFEFTVTDMRCAVGQVGSKDFGQKAQGEYCLVTVTVKNIATSVEAWDSSSQKAYDAKNAEYAADGGAEAYVNNQGQTFLESINPGNQVTGILVFDVPKGTKLASVVLHESHFTAGVRIPLK